MRFDTAETRWNAAARKKWRGERPPAFLWPLHFGPRRGEPVEPAGAARSPVVQARVNHGTWQTECPFCPSAQHASDTEPRFYCADCMNAANSHRTLPVKWPKNRDAIEAELAHRPYPHQRHWEPGETIRDIQHQREEATP